MTATTTTMMSDNEIVWPGTQVTTSATKIGPGLHLSHDDHTLVAIRPGLLHDTTKSCHLSTSSKRYLPALNDTIIAQVTARFAEGYRVDMGAALSGTLDALAFEHVNRKSKPNLTVGALVYARIDACHAAMEPDIVCLTQDNKAGGFGVLEAGYLLTGLSLNLCRRLLSPTCIVLSAIGERVEYEVVVGMNGRIWVSADDKRTLLLIVQILKQVEFLTESEARDLITRTLRDV